MVPTFPAPPTLVLPPVTKPSANMISISISKQSHTEHLLMTSSGQSINVGETHSLFFLLGGAHPTPNKWRNKVTKEGFMISNVCGSRHVVITGNKFNTPEPQFPHWVVVWVK